MHHYCKKKDADLGAVSVDNLLKREGIREHLVAGEEVAVNNHSCGLCMYSTSDLPLKALTRLSLHFTFTAHKVFLAPPKISPIIGSAQSTAKKWTCLKTGKTENLKTDDQDEEVISYLCRLSSVRWPC
jgi:wobble nucleotide-excising tRNase